MWNAPSLAGAGTGLAALERNSLLTDTEENFFLVAAADAANGGVDVRDDGVGTRAGTALATTACNCGFSASPSFGLTAVPRAAGSPPPLVPAAAGDVPDTTAGVNVDGAAGGDASPVFSTGTPPPPPPLAGETSGPEPAPTEGAGGATAAAAAPAWSMVVDVVGDGPELPPPWNGLALCGFDVAPSLAGVESAALGVGAPAAALAVASLTGSTGVWCCCGLRCCT